uniref:Uncharacterized protein n=1 Tax=Anguilla anguilla TaxID=7936 RepID=A0A0E9PE82_ANGAN
MIMATTESKNQHVVGSLSQK